MAALKETLGQEISPDVEWQALWAETGKQFPQTNTFVPNVVMIVSAWNERLLSRLENDIYAQWSEQLLEALSEVKTRVVKLHIQVCGSLRFDPEYLSLNNPLSHLDPFLTVRRRNGTPNFHPSSSRCPTPHPCRCPPSLVASRVTLKSSLMQKPRRSRRSRRPRKKRGLTLSTRRPVPRRSNPFLELLPVLPVLPVLPSHRSRCQPNVCPPSICSNAPRSSCGPSRLTS